MRFFITITLSCLLLSPSAHAAVSAPAAEHSNHAAPAGTGESAGRRGMAGAATMPVAWTAFPILKTRMGGDSRDRRTVYVIPQGIVADSVDAYSNNFKDKKAHRQLVLDLAGARLDKPETGGFHWLSAREEQADKVRVASTVQFFSERGGQNPTPLFMQQKHELEIIPQPYPREHSRYRAKEDWRFMVRFNGRPLANQKVLLETANGTRSEQVSDAQGVVMVRIPDDFDKVEQKESAGAHDHGRRGSDFVLATEHADGGKTYLTAFNGSYGPNAFDQRSLAMGLGFTLLGMLGAAPLLRQRKIAKQADEAARNKEV